MKPAKGVQIAGRPASADAAPGCHRTPRHTGQLCPVPTNKSEKDSVMAKHTIAATLAAAVSAALIAACGSSAPLLTRSAAPTAPPPLPAPDFQHGVVRKLVIDQTGSSVRTFATNVLTAVADDLVRRNPAPPPGDPTSGRPAVPALDLYVRTVSTHCFTTSAPSLERKVPAVPALPGPPRITDDNLAQDELAWAAEANAWREAAAAANSVAAHVADELRSLRLDRTSFSAISACVAAIADSGPQGPDVTLLLASDLIDNEPRIAASLHGGPVIVIQSCPASTELACRSRASTWTGELQHQGAGQVTVVRADAASTAIAQWLEVAP